MYLVQGDTLTAYLISFENLHDAGFIFMADVAQAFGNRFYKN